VLIDCWRLDTTKSQYDRGASRLVRNGKHGDPLDCGCEETMLMVRDLQDLGRTDVLEAEEFLNAVERTLT
jgi:hypothetical protein